MNHKQRQARAAVIRTELVRMSRDGWSRVRFDDYHPLEIELRALDAGCDGEKCLGCNYCDPRRLT